MTASDTLGEFSHQRQPNDAHHETQSDGLVDLHDDKQQQQLESAGYVHQVALESHVPMFLSTACICPREA